MKQVILIHGSPEPGEIATQESITPDWFLWIQQQVPHTVIPPMPLEVEVVYNEWVTVFENYTLSPDSIIVGHSCGGGFLLRYFSEHPELRVSKIILVAPWIDPRHELGTIFMKFQIDCDFAKRNETHVFISSDDMESIVESVAVIEQQVSGITWHRFTDREHFCGRQEFPELLEILK